MSGKDLSRPDPLSPDVSRRMSGQRSRDTGIERELRATLHRRGLRYRVHVRLLPGLRREADIVFPRSRVAVFVDGCFWHGCGLHGTWPRSNAQWWREKIESNQQRDRDTDARLRDAGWLPLRVWEHELTQEAADRIEHALSERGGHVSPPPARLSG